jgi:hypothetical protein
MYRVALFLTLCIGARVLFAYLSHKINKEYLPVLGIIAIVVATGFIRNFLTKKKVGSFGQDVWWNDIRPIHALIYFLFGLMSLQKFDHSYVLLLIDVCIGLYVFIVNKAFT